MSQLKPLFLSLLVLAALCANQSRASASIETGNPVKVTHKNSGPSYDIEVERTRMAPEEEMPANNNRDSFAEERPRRPEMNSANPEQEETPSIGRVSIRRIFLVPMMPGGPQESLWSSPSSSPEAEEVPQRPSFFRHLHFGPVRRPEQSGPVEGESNIRPSFPLSLSHLFGQDQASRSPQEQPARANENQPSPVDPIQMMIEMMQQAMQQALAGNQQPGDLNKEASASKPETEGGKPDESKQLEPTDRVGGLKPINESKEEIVEIDGKKYIRKSVVNKHVGENMIFMTKRLIFTPLNETTDASSTTTTTTTTTTGRPTTVLSEGRDLELTTSAPVSTTTTTTTTTSEQPKETSSVGAPVQPEVASTTIQPEAPTTSQPEQASASTEAASASSSSAPEAGGKPEETTTTSAQ